MLFSAWRLPPKCHIALQSLDKVYQQEERPTGSRLEVFYQRRQAAVLGLLACSGSKSCCQYIKNLPLTEAIMQWFLPKITVPKYRLNDTLPGANFMGVLSVV